jgi:hypothetical protein
MIIHAPISLGELIDKITILEIKLVKIVDPVKLKNINNELDKLRKIYHDIILTPDVDCFHKDLYNVNLELWKFEDQIRECNLTNEQFISIAKQIHKTNDQRSVIKKHINLTFNSDIVEEKSYKNLEL